MAICDHVDFECNLQKTIYKYVLPVKSLDFLILLKEVFYAQYYDNIW